MVIHNPILTGSFTVNNIDVSSITSSAANISSINAITASILSTTGSLNTASGSAITRLGALEVTSGSNITRLSALETASGSAITRLGALEVTSGSNITRLGALETASGSAITRLGSIEVVTGSNITRLSSLEAKTGSYATTGSNTFIGSQVVSGSIVQSGSFTTTGTIIAQTINVQTVTSSIVYSSGSNIFGNLLGDSQRFTGSVLVTGSLTISTGGNASAPIIFGSTIACSPIGCFATSCATSFIGGTMSGTTIYGSTAVCSPVGKFTSCIDAGSGNFSSNVCVGGGLVAQQASTFGNTVAVFGSTAQLYIGATAGVSDYTILKWCTTDKSLNIHNQSTNGSPQLVIACNGNIGVKTTTAPNYDLEVKGNIGIISSTSAGLITTSTLCAAGTITGLVRFDGLHTPSLTTYTGPSINACKDDANYATSLVFKTIDGSGGNNVNLRITGAGVACFASTVCAPLFVGGVINGSGFCTSGGIVGNNSNNLYLSSNSAAGEISFWGNQLNTRLMTITGCGNVGIGFTGYGGSKLTLVASTNPTCASSANMQLSIGEASQNTTYSFKLGYIYVGGGYIGAIQTIAGGVASTTVINPDGGNVGIGTSSPNQNLTVLKNQNADTAAGIYNQTDGTASSTTLRLDNGSYNGQLNLYANSYITSGTAVANTLRLYTDGPGGMSFSATNQHMRFYTSPNECLRMTILYGGSVGIGNANPRTQLDVGDIVNGVGGTTFCAFLVAQGVWATFACVTNNDTNVVTDITYVNNNDYNRSGVFVARWAYNDTCAALYIRSCLWNDSQNIGSFGLRNNGGALQICITGGSNGYRVQARTQGARATG